MRYLSQEQRSIFLLVFILLFIIFTRSSKVTRAAN